MGALLEKGIQKKHNLYNARSNFKQLLQDVSPSGGTCLRDSICHGIKKILQMNADIPQNIPNLDFHFLHIILTDGEDDGSITKDSDMKNVMKLLASKLTKKQITNHFIGINMSCWTQRKLRILSELGGDTCEFHLGSSTDTKKIFARIYATIEVQKQIQLGAIKTNDQMGVIVHQKQEINLKISQKRFIVVFNLDISGSMEGSSWKQVRLAISNFTNSFKEDDLFAFILFNDSIRELIPTKEQIEGVDLHLTFEELKEKRRKKESKCTIF